MSFYWMLSDLDPPNTIMVLEYVRIIVLSVLSGFGSLLILYGVYKEAVK